MFKFIIPDDKKKLESPRKLIPGCYGQTGNNPLIVATGNLDFFHNITDHLYPFADAFYVSHGDKRRELEAEVRYHLNLNRTVLLHFQQDYYDFDPFWTGWSDALIHGLSPTRARVDKLRDADDRDKVIDLSGPFLRIMNRWEAP